MVRIPSWSVHLSLSPVWQCFSYTTETTVFLGCRARDVIPTLWTLFANRRRRSGEAVALHLEGDVQALSV